MSNIVEDNQYVASGHQKIAVSDDLVPLPAALITQTLGDGPHSATGVLIQARTAPIYYTFDGTDPATDGSTGFSLATDDYLKLNCWRNIQNFQCIRQGTTDAAIIVTPFFNDAGWPV